MKRVIVTGAGGFVGSNLARRLLSDGHEVHLLLRPGHDAWRLRGLRGDARTHEVDIGDAEGLERVVSGVRPEWVFHLAAHGAYPAQTDVRRMVRTNMLGTINLVEACTRLGFEAFVNTGSSSEYGFKDHAPREDELPEPNSHYAVTKTAATLYCRNEARSRGLRLPTLRLYSVYGPYEEPTRLIPALVVRGLRGELPPLADAAAARDFVYVDDVVEAYMLAATEPVGEPGAVYNVGTGVQTTLRDVSEAARRVMDIRAEPEWGTMPARSWDTEVWVADSRKIQTELGWRPRFTLEEGLRATAHWLRSDPAMLNFYSSFHPGISFEF